MNKYSKEDIEKIEEYLKSKNEIIKFVLNRRILAIIFFYVGIISILLMLGGGSFLNHIVKVRIDKAISEKVDEEYSYLSHRNKITEIGDLAISTGKITYYEDLIKYLDSKKQERILIAAKAEILNVESFFIFHGDQYFSEEKLEYVSSDGEIFKSYKIPTEGLIKIFRKTDNFGKKTTVLQILQYRYEKNIPEFLLDVAFATDNLRMRYLALITLQILIDDSANPFNYEENKNLWQKCKEDYLIKVEKLKK